MNVQNIIFLSIPFFFGSLALELAWSAYKKMGLYRFADTLSNLSNGVIEEILNFIPKAILLALYVPLSQLWSSSPFNNYSVTTWILCYVLDDFIYYWFHRWTHRTQLGWAAHAVHHQSEEYNLSVALRQSAFQSTFNIPLQLIPALLGFPVEVMLGCIAINLVYQFWIHTKLIGRMGIFEWIMNTPSHHRVHHAVNPRYLDKNYAGTFIIWDKVFGTFQEEDPGEEEVYGVTEQLQTFNPFEAQILPYVKLGKKIWNSPTWTRKLEILWRPPAWEFDRGKEVFPAFDPFRVKYDPVYTPNRKIWIGLAFVIFLAAGLLILSPRT